jgi:hypothetical protein
VSAARRSVHRLRIIAIAVVLAPALAACGSAEPSGVLGPCGDDARSIGGYPVMEALLPTALVTRAPDKVDSGRSCSDAALGTLTSHGIHELRFAGATWNQGGSDATVIAVLATPSEQPLPQEAWIEEFYAAGAVAGKHTGAVTTDRPTMQGAGEVFRIETINDLSLQTVVIWEDHGLIHVVIVATMVDPNASRAAHDERVAIAVAVAAAGRGPEPSLSPGTQPSSEPVLPSGA